MPKQKNTSATATAHQCGNRELACGFLANAAAASVAGLLAAPSLVRAGRVSQAENSMHGQRAWTNNTATRPFRIDIRETAADQSQGVQMAKMHELIRYWGTEYDWWKVEAKLNALPQFVTEIDGLGIHFIHVRSPHGNALRLLLTHGWLRSILEFVKGHRPTYGSDGLRRTRRRRLRRRHTVHPRLRILGQAKGDRLGSRPYRTAWDVLMKRLEYTRYVSQGGDHGPVISTVMARQAPAGLLGIHLTMPATVPEMRRGPSAVAISRQSACLQARKRRLNLCKLSLRRTLAMA